MSIVFDNIQAFLLWLGSAPAGIAILSFIAERSAWYQEQSPKVKQGIAWGVAIILPQIALALLDVVPADIWGQLEPRFQAVLTSVSIIAALFFGELAHSVDKRFLRR